MTTTLSNEPTGGTNVASLPGALTDGDANFWHGLIDEKTAADFLGMTVRFMQAKRQHGGGPRFVRISSRCIRYRRSDLNNYADKHLRVSTSDEATAA